jgi:hypothetical protein
MSPDALAELQRLRDCGVVRYRDGNRLPFLLELMNQRHAGARVVSVKLGEDARGIWRDWQLTTEGRWLAEEELRP